MITQLQIWIVTLSSLLLTQPTMAVNGLLKWQVLSKAIFKLTTYTIIYAQINNKVFTGGGVSTNHKSSNRIQLSQLDDDLLDF